MKRSRNVAPVLQIVQNITKNYWKKEYFKKGENKREKEKWDNLDDNEREYGKRGQQKKIRKVRLPWW